MGSVPVSGERHLPASRSPSVRPSVRRSVGVRFDVMPLDGAMMDMSFGIGGATVCLEMIHTAGVICAGSRSDLAQISYLDTASVPPAPATNH